MTRTQWNAFACIPLANHHLRERHTYIHGETCMHRDDDFLSPTECADEHLRHGGGGGGVVVMILTTE